MKTLTHPIIVVGSSAGGWESLPSLLESLPDDFPASLFIVQHLGGESLGTGFLTHLNKHSSLPCAFAIDREPIRQGRVYLAPPDYHMLLTDTSVRISHGPRENGIRPSVDTLFRSAAFHHKNKVIGVILSGMGDDGVEGLATISRTGGITVVQDPETATYPDMAKAALQQMEVDYKPAIADLGLVINSLIYYPQKPNIEVPQDVSIEANIAERVLTSIDDIEEIGTSSGFSCPDCGGVLWDIDHRNGVHSFRCHAGHAFGVDSLFKLKSKEVEEAMWASLRLLEERKRMLKRFPITNMESNSLEKRIAENERYIDVLKSLLLSKLPDSDAN